MGTKSKVSFIKEKLNKLEKQLETIQKDCSHKTKSMRFLNLNKGVRWVCDDCQQIVKIPTPEEIEKWVKK